MRLTIRLFAFILLVATTLCIAQEGQWGRMRRPNESVVYTGTIVNRETNQCLEIAGGSRDYRAAVQQFNCNGTNAQNWRISRTQNNEYVLRNVASDKVLQVQGGSMNIGTRMEQSDSNNAAAQRWRLESGRGPGGGGYRLVNVNSGLCLEAGAGVRGDRSAVVQNRCGGFVGVQRWAIGNLQLNDRDRDEDVRDDGPRWPGRRGGEVQPLRGRVIATGSLMNRASGKCLDVDGADRPGAKIQQWRCSGYDNQKWNIVDVGNGEVAILLPISQKVADVDNASRNSGATLHQYDWHGGANQRWRIRKLGDYWQFVNVGSGKCLDVQRETQGNNGGTVQQWNCGDGDNQQWGVR